MLRRMIKTNDFVFVSDIIRYGEKLLRNPNLKNSALVLLYQSKGTSYCITFTTTLM
jgi:hypothetical protein